MFVETHPAALDRLSVHAELRDVRYVDMPQYLGVSHPAGVVHHMALDLEIDRELTIVAAKAWMGTVPFEPGPKTRGEGCRDIAAAYERLVGTRLDRGYAPSVLEIVGGRQGCFHVLSLAQCLPYAVRAATQAGGDFRRQMRITARVDDRMRLGLAGELDDRSGGFEVARTALELWLGMPGFTVLEASGAPGLEGLSITKGFTAAALERIGGGPGSEHLSALVIAATPVVPQASGALAGFLKLSPEQKLRGRAGSPQTDSCHMWRSDGPLMGLETKRS